MRQYKKIAASLQNPHASSDLKLTMLMAENTPPKEVQDNTRRNSIKHKIWLQQAEEHDSPAIMINSGPSINNHIEDIKNLQRKGAVVFAMNGASKWAHKHGINVDHQVIADATEGAATHVDKDAQHHLFASQCNPKTTDASTWLTLWHLNRDGIEDLLPPERVEQGGYVLVGGDATVGVISLCVAYAMGYRDFHVFGMDTSHKKGKGHAFDQPINKNMPTMAMEWGGEKYVISMGLKLQIGAFFRYTHDLKAIGCEFAIYGDGLLQAMYNADFSKLSEREKYQLMWVFDEYGRYSPGEQEAQEYLDQFKPEGMIIDFGCGTGRAGILFAKTNKVFLIDITDNSRDEGALRLPFKQWDITVPIPIDAPNGFCTDVMEHIPTDDVETVINNIMDSAENVFFQISTVPDTAGAMVGLPLHLTVRPHKWWADLFEILGYEVKYQQDKGPASTFYIQHIGENNAS